jgi:glycosyltransferase involved in cell wall biosynthesis
MASGTPVLAFNRGAMPEIISHGRTGFLCENVDSMIDAVKRIHTLDRKACRFSIETRFAPDIIAAEHEKLYRSLLNR